MDAEGNDICHKATNYKRDETDAEAGGGRALDLINGILVGRLVVGKAVGATVKLHLFPKKF